jgi:Mrp family chromosome partitioning ATPase
MIIQVELLRVREDTQRVKLRQAAVTPREISFPKLQYYIPLGAVMMLGLVAGIVFLREFMDQRVRQPSDLMGLSGCRLLGVVPDISDDPSDPGSAERVVTKHPNSVTAEMFRQVASQARKAVEGGALRTVAVVSAHPQGGTSTVVTNLAACAASAGRRTAVVDANFRRPKLAELYGLDPETPGVGDMLKGVAVKPHMVDGVAVYPAGTSANRTLEMLLGGDMGKLLTQLRDEYEFVLIDLPPALVAGESMVIVHASDASVLVVRALEDHRGLVGKMVGQLLDTSATLVGCVLMRPMNTAGGYFKKNAELMAEYSKEQKAA